MSRKTKKRKRRTVGDWIRYTIMAAALGVFLFSGAQLVGIFSEYKKGEEEYSKIREYVKEEPQTSLQGESVEEEEGPEPPSVDWEGLKAINQDLIGWLKIEGTEISYPVVKGRDNEYYLKHTFEGNSNSAGAIFAEYTNNGDFTDCNTIIYGHNMKNGSMFGLLRKYFQKEADLPGKYIWICTPEKNYRYEIFSSHVVDAAGEVYTLFSEPSEEFEAYLKSMVSQSYINFGISPVKEDRIITLSTCTGNDATRFVVQARQEGEY